MLKDSQAWVLAVMAATTLGGCAYKYEVRVRDPAQVAVVTPEGMLLPPGRSPARVLLPVRMTKSVAMITLLRKEDGSIQVDHWLEDEPLVPRTGHIRYAGNEWHPMFDPVATQFGLVAIPINYALRECKTESRPVSRYGPDGYHETTYEDVTICTGKRFQPLAWLVTPWSNIVKMGPLTGLRGIWGRRWYSLNMAPAIDRDSFPPMAGPHHL